MLLGSGELGKEVVIAAKRIGCQVIACDRYANAPAMQVADKAEVFDMTNEKILKKAILKHQPDIIIPEIEALAVNALIDIENNGITVIPNAKATTITMNRDKIRDLANIKLGIKTAKFDYASSQEELIKISSQLGWPVVIKPVMSSSGKGQSIVETSNELQAAWDYAMKEARGTSPRVIVEEFLRFDLEITLLTVRQRHGPTLFCEPIGHEQANGDYQSSWQPAVLNTEQLKQAQAMAEIITNELGGAGVFGVEFFICGKEVIFSELSPRPHDTGLVTLISQNLSEFELHLRAILGLPIPSITQDHAAASRVILAKEVFESVAYKGLENALEADNTKVLLFGKPNSKKGRRMGVTLAKGDTINEAILKADHAAKQIEVIENKTGNLTI